MKNYLNISSIIIFPSPKRTTSERRLFKIKKINTAEGKYFFLYEIFLYGIKEISDANVRLTIGNVNKIVVIELKKKLQHRHTLTLGQ